MSEHPPTAVERAMKIQQGDFREARTGNGFQLYPEAN
jgi:hypothetical protein